MGLDDLTAFAAEEKTTQTRESMRSSIYISVDTDPEEYAALQKAGQRLGIPASVLPRDRNEMRRLEVSRDPTLDELPETHPKTAEYLSDPENAKLSWDDVQSLANVEGVFKQKPIDTRRVSYGNRDDVTTPVGKAFLSGLSVSPEKINQSLATTGRVVADVLDWASGFDKTEDSIWKVASRIAKESADYWQRAADAKMRKPATWGEGIAQQAGQSIGTSLLAAPFGIGGSGPALSMFSLSSVDPETYDKMLTKGYGVPLSAANVASRAAMEGLTEKLGMDEIYKGTGPILKRAIRFTLGDLGGEEVNTIYNAIADKVTINPDMTMGDVMQQVIDTAVVTAVAGPIQGVTMQGAAKVSGGLYNVYQQQQQAQASKDFMTALGEGAKASKVRERMPERFQQFVASLREDGPVENVYVPVEQWNTLFQSESMDPARAAEDLLSQPERYYEALATGGDVVIPLDEYAAKIAPSEYHQKLVDDIRLHPGDMTSRESAAWGENADKHIEELLASVQEEAATPGQDTSDAVYQDVFGQRLGTGATRETAEREATLWQSVFRTLGQRTGMDPMELYQQYSPRIYRPLPDVLAKRVSVDTALDPFLDRLRGNEPGPTELDMYGPSITEFLAQAGGVMDQGGELRAMDADKLRRPFQKGLVKKDGLTLDRAWEKAAEAGYLAPESTVKDLLDLIASDLKGERKYAPGGINDAAVNDRATLDQLRDVLDRAGVDLAQSSNEDVRRVLNQMVQGDGVTRWQSAWHGSQRQDTGPNRGFFRFGGGKFEIALLEKADLSTFLHESAHFYLEVMGDLSQREDAPQQVKDDYAQLLQWFGVEARADVVTEHHEKFARGFESYLMEGKAPTPELQSIFQRFKAWLVTVYRNVSRLNVTLSDEVRGVFDRLVATDEEITRARDGARLNPIFATAEAAGMTAAEFEAYRKTAETANAVESERLERKLVDQLTREQKEWWKEQRNAMREEVEREAKQNPVYEALNIILKGEDFDGNKPERSIKIDRATLVQMYGDAFLKRLPRGFGHLYAKEGGLHPDAVAEIFGFSSGDDMIRQMIETPKMGQWIEAETDVRMREKHGDMLNDGTLAEEAIKAIHEGDQRANVLAAELRAIRRKQREIAPFMQARKDADRQSGADRRTMEASIPPLAYFRSAAAATIAGKQVRDLNPNVYLQAETKASKEAFDAAAKGDWVAAGDAKYRQLLNHHLYREAVAAKDETAKIRDYLTRMGAAKNLRRVGQAGQGFLAQIQGILERFDLSKISGAQIDRNLQQFLDDLYEETGMAVPVDEAIGNERYRKNWKELTVEELRALNDSVKAIEHAAREVSKVKSEAGAIFLEEAEEMLVDQAERANEKEVKQFLTKSSMSHLDRASDELRKFDQMILRPERIIEWLDGGETGPWHDLLWNKAVDADNKRNDLRASLLLQLQSIMETVTKGHDKRLREVYHIKELGTDMSISEMIGVALNVGNDSNREKLMKGGVYVGAERRMIDAIALDEILGHLRKEEWDMVQGLWDTVDSLWPQIAELETRRSGLPPVKVEASPITNEHGTFRGGYWPAVYDPRHSRQGEKQADANRTDQMFGASFSKAATRKGHVKERVQNFARPMNLDWQAVVSRHVDNVITDLSHWGFVFDVRRLLARDGVRKAVQTRIGDTAFRSLEGWLKYTVQADYYGDPAAGALQTIRQRAVSNLAVAALGFKVATAAGNLVVAPVQAADRVAPKFLAQGIGEFMRNPAAAIDTAAALSGQMRHRIHEMDKSFQETLNNLAGRDSIRAKVARASMAVHMWVDRIGSTAIWLGAYREAQSKGMDGMDAIRHADKSIRMTQTAGAPKDLSAFERDPRYQEFKLFLGPMLIMGNGIRSQFREKGAAVAWNPEAWGKLFALWFGPAIIFELVVGRGPDEDDEEGWAAWGLKKLLLYPFQTIPVIREFANVAEGYITGRKRDVRNLPMYEAGAAVLDAANKTYKAVQGEAEPEKAVKSVAGATGLAVGLPTQQLTVTGEFLYDVLSGQYEPDHVYSPLRDIFLKRKEQR